MSRQRPWRREQRRAALGVVLLLVAYFVIPGETHPDRAVMAIRVALTLAALVAVLWLVTHQARRQLTDAPSGVGQIARAFVCAQMVFSVGVLAAGVSVLVRQVVPGSRS